MLRHVSLMIHCSEDDRQVKYTLKKGVVMFEMCGERFIVPSREAGPIPVVLTVSPEMRSVLEAEQGVSEDSLSPETRKKLQLYTAAGILEVH